MNSDIGRQQALERKGGSGFGSGVNAARRVATTGDEMRRLILLDDPSPDGANMQASDSVRVPYGAFRRTGFRAGAGLVQFCAFLCTAAEGYLWLGRLNSRGCAKTNPGAAD